MTTNDDTDNLSFMLIDEDGTRQVIPIKPRRFNHNALLDVKRTPPHRHIERHQPSKHRKGRG